MKIKKTIRLLLPSLVLATVISGGGFAQQASAQEGLGGAVQTNGHIGFYQEEQPESSSSEESSAPQSTTSEPASTEASTTTVAKPTGGGQYPSTGELVKKSLSLSGVALVVMAGLLILYKRRKKEEGQ